MIQLVIHVRSEIQPSLLPVGSASVSAFRRSSAGTELTWQEPRVVLLNLAANPQYDEPLREEVEAKEEWSGCNGQGTQGRKFLAGDAGIWERQMLEYVTQDSQRLSDSNIIIIPKGTIPARATRHAPRLVCAFSNADQRIRADHIRSANSAAAWTQYDLDAYHIEFQLQVSTAFFNMPALPLSTIDEDVVMADSYDDAVKDNNRSLLDHMFYVMSAKDEHNQSTASLFAIELLRAVRYHSSFALVQLRTQTQLSICGASKHAEVIVSITDCNEEETILLVELDKYYNRRALKPLPRPVAHAIAAFQMHNDVRAMSGLDPVEQKARNSVILAIIMLGTLPTFVKIPVTTELDECVRSGEYPTFPTVVQGHIPEIPSPLPQSDAMKPLDNRRVIFQCFEAFRQFIFFSCTYNANFLIIRCRCNGERRVYEYVPHWRSG
ncbi:hypothetical protein BJ138DRAFT_1230878 [Hygrophoropsis aurantiaca]|uniref:Uncharacterized protein n=1 Tax=Hygrophoropsis aurantiaca TaxID=72124 RepID=A0ACB8AGV2_9AGAM|nr:hypothetical protein BJ138DRAFT_1230878 [Hygrophoropsis aurantiaca]